MKKIVFILITFLSFCTVSAKEVLNVQFIFDTNTSQYDNTGTGLDYANDLMLQLKESFRNSNLDSVIDFQLNGHYGGPIDYMMFAPSPTSEFKSLNDMLTFFRKTENQGDYIDLPNGGKSMKMKSLIHFMQDFFESDITIVVVNPEIKTDVCGEVLFLPNKSYLNDQYPTIESIIENSDTSIIFLIDNPICNNMIERVAHEVGHTFGLFHGPAAQLVQNKEGHYNPEISIEPYANGYGDLSYGLKYGTIMSGRYLNILSYDIDNTFSDKTKSDCGIFNFSTCGSSDADAVSVIKKYAPIYNMRGDWFKK